MVNAAALFPYSRVGDAPQVVWSAVLAWRNADWQFRVSNWGLPGWSEQPVYQSVSHNLKVWRSLAGCFRRLTAAIKTQLVSALMALGAQE